MDSSLRSVGLLPATAYVLASDAPIATVIEAMSLKTRYGALVQFCDGVADEVEIQAAINAMSPNGGTVRLSEGNFTIGATINLAKKIAIEGSAGIITTQINLANAANCHMIRAVADGSGDVWALRLRDLHLSGNAANQGAGDWRGISIEASGGGDALKDGEMHRVYVSSCKGSGIVIYPWGWRISACLSEINQKYGWYISGTQTYMIDCFGFGNGIDGTPLSDFVLTGGPVNSSAIHVTACHSQQSLGGFYAERSVTLMECDVANPTNGSNDAFRLGSSGASILLKAIGCRVQGNTHVTNAFRIYGPNNSVIGCTAEGYTGYGYAIQASADRTLLALSYGSVQDLGTRSRFSRTMDYVPSGEERSIVGSLLQTGTFLTNTSGVLTESGVHLKPGAQTLHITGAGTFTFTLPAGTTGTVANGTATLVGGPTIVLANGLVIDSGATIGTITVTLVVSSLDIPCPETQDCLIRRVEVDITTPGGTATAVLQIGLSDDAVGLNLGSEFFTAADANAAAILDSFLAGDTGAQTKFVVWPAAGANSHLHVQVNTEKADAIVGKVSVYYAGR